MNAVTIAVDLAYLVAAAGFVVALHLMNSPATARRGSRLSWLGMIVAGAAALTSVIHEHTITATGCIVLSVGGLGGMAAGLVMARRVKMTDVPQVVSIFNAVGGGAAALVAIGDFVRLDGGAISSRVMIATVLDVIIGPVTFSGSLIAAAKLQGWVSSSPVVFRGARLITAALTVVGIGAGCYLLAGHNSMPVLILVVCAALAFGVTMTMPIGGADMPVVVALLNSFTGIAVAIAGFVIDNGGLIIGGALVGASGGILTVLMAQAMNRSVISVMLGGFGTGDSGPAVGPAAAGAGASIRRISAEDAAIQLAYASKVIIVPGYGLAAAQAQHEAAELAALLQAQHETVLFAIHPVAGRMPGHMNVLLAEANVPYTDLKEMDAANPEFPTADVALVLGANDVTNPAARRPGNPVSGMPILNVDQAKSVIVIKRSMGHGYAGIDNELYTDPKTGMFFSDAKAGLAEIIASVKALVAS
jgi:NAD(P) transhydrogenase subunit beta